jgi:hypothetical protein
MVLLVELLQLRGQLAWTMLPGCDDSEPAARVPHIHASVVLRRR